MLVFKEDSMLYVNSGLKDRLEKALQFAHKINKEHNLLANLYRMGEGWNRKPYVCFLYSDFAAHSFTFACYDLTDCVIWDTKENCIFENKSGAKCWLSGGLIYHGPLEDDQESETFSIQLTENNGWSIHT